MPAATPKTYLVVGGDGFLGRHLVRALLAKEGTVVRILDRQASVKDLKENPRVKYCVGDLRSKAHVLSAMEGVDCTIHCAAVIFGNDYELMHSINVLGTQNVIDACHALGCRRLVYTSSASVTLDLSKGSIYADETSPYPEVPVDTYNRTKAEAEKRVIGANAPGTLHTAVIRPSGIFGPEDRTMMAQTLRVAVQGKTGMQIGNNTELADFTYVDNAVHGHLLAAERLEDPAVQGQVFLITNGEPILFWDMLRSCWTAFGTTLAPPTRLPYPVALGIAHAMEGISLLLSPFVRWEPTLSTFKVRTVSANRYFNIDKARTILGYAPIVPLEEGIHRAVQWFKDHPEDL
jgi:sterol-4alpha-carboxylate 3-dehydrogenase (decarboxylating)